MPQLFVYGTLMTGQLRNRYLTEEGARFLRLARTAARYALFRPFLADYPCLVEDTRQGVCIEGELWEVSEECLRGLDAVEGVPDLFQRRMITLEDGEEVQAYVMPAKPWLARRLGNRWAP